MKSFEQWMEEWKPFPHDKVQKQIKKKKEQGKTTKAHRQAGKMEGIARVMKTTDAHKTGSKQAGSSYNKTGAKETEAYAKARVANDEVEKAKKDREKSDAKTAKKHAKFLKKIEKGDKKGKIVPQAERDKVSGKIKKKNAEAFAKHRKAYDDLGKREYQAHNRTGERAAVTRNRDKYVPYKDEEGNARKDYRGGMKDSKSDLERQAEHNRKVNADRRTAKKMMKKSEDVSKAEKMLKAKPKKERIKGPKVKGTIKKEHMDYTEYLASIRHPIYEKDGEVPKCPPGYKWDAKMVMCVPKSPKDSVGPSDKYSNKDMKPGSGPGYNVWGNSGYSGAGYAWEEPPTTHDGNGNGGGE